jgi:putative addiction module component (TIGR02574 family)
MDRSLEQVTQDAIQLPRQQRFRLTRLLLDLDRPGTSDEADAAWEQEIEARIRAFDEGRVEAVDYDDFRKEMTSRFSA